MTKALDTDECASSSDPENTYNEYDLAEDEFGENFEAIGESVEKFSRTLSPSSVREQFVVFGLVDIITIMINSFKFSFKIIYIF